MLIWMKFALCAAIVLSTAATASAATKKKTTAHRSSLRVQTSALPAAPLVNPYRAQRATNRSRRSFHGNDTGLNTNAHEPTVLHSRR
jgi:hypothetical protein